LSQRLDKILHERALVSSRSQAKSLIEKGDVLVDGEVVRKAGALISQEASIEVVGPQFVGRGAFKLLKALEEFSPEVTAKIYLDIGASTGGFTEVLLERGVAKVYAIDVGRGQLAQKLRDDPRVINLEGHNIKDIEALDELADGAVVDLSFISLTKVLSAISRLLKPQADLIVLIKPQFEAGPERIPKDGIIKSDVIRNEILTEVLEYATKNNWILQKQIPSPIEGKAGNKEFLAHFIKA
jgi:23S rRNA (cytidine1920-2'-O)/16S rRNA (cytidine1409-2'-O)-methyltransferase